MLATLAGFVVMFVLGYLFYMVIFGQMLSDMTVPALKELYDADPNMPVMILSQLILVWAMTVVFLKGYEGGSGTAEGLRFGIWAWLLVSVSSGLGFVAFGMSGWGQFALEVFINLIMFAVTGMVIGMVAGKPAAAGGGMEHAHTTEV